MRLIKQLPNSLKEYWLKDISFPLLFVFLFTNMFVISPMVGEIEGGIAVFNLSLLAILFSGIWSAAKRVFRLIGGGLFVVVATFKIVRLFTDDNTYYTAELIITTIYLLYLIKTNFALLFRDNEVNLYRIVGAVNVYLLIALVGGFLFLLMEITHPGCFSNSAEINNYEEGLNSFIYFSLVSLSTVGYGDIYPVYSYAKSLSVLIAVLGLLYPTLVIARLISLELKKE